MRAFVIIFSFLILVSCSQDSPNIQQIENLQFFIDNKKNDQVVEIEPGLQYLVIDSGDPDSETPELTQTISAHFHGTLTNGEVFWSSLDSEPLEIELSKLIVGCQKTISLMRAGDKWMVYIDPTMAYGEEGRPGIPSNSILIFEIELLEIS
jgi:FKBP-type peptidyl-prolyl cis-trans isomerase FklB|tara:strand:- start:96 stop:548 length:453 start_codon:yes stop_codon:yes gene_type:complete